MMMIERVRNKHAALLLLLLLDSAGHWHVVTKRYHPSLVPRSLLLYFVFVAESQAETTPD